MSTFAEDADKLLAAIEAAIAAAMPSVAEEIKNCIADHVQSEIYTHESKVYPRSHTLLSGALDAKAFTDGTTASVDYNPSGVRPGTWAEMPENVRLKYGKSPSDPIKPNPLSGDAFIQRIETGSYDYDTKFGARPFLTHAVTDLIEGKRALNAFIDAFNANATDGLQAVDMGDQEIFRTADDFAGYA